MSRYWHLADISYFAAHVRFRGQSGHGFSQRKCPLMTQSGHGGLSSNEAELYPR